MKPIDRKVKTFLSLERIAIAGVSHSSERAANGIYRKLKNSDYTVSPVNPNMETFDGNSCYPDVKSIPGGVEGVVIITDAAHTNIIFLRKDSSFAEFMSKL